MEFTPTFLGCPALEVMRDAMAGADQRARRGRSDSRDLGRLLVDRPNHPEGREKLRASGFAPPAPVEVGGPKLVQLQSNAFRCPYCGSQDTALENIFGPTPCRSVRYCRSCRQPFEQFKTI